MSLTSLVYVSLQTRPLHKADFALILDACERNNPKLGITGMLLYRSGYFIQAIEGDEVAVTTLYNKIAADQRHRNIITVEKSVIESRAFSSWTMGFKNLDEIDMHSIPRYSDFAGRDFHPEQLIEHNSRATQLLNVFRSEAHY